ncbi:MAG: gluconate kinase [Caulobacteraceae bacterium]|nr:MAG: gluconate kinase [Caulobacteraceae bacterium]
MSQPTPEELQQEAEIAAWLAARADRVIETSCARVYLTGELALKVKKPVNFGFLNYETAALRHWALERELAFNRAAAPDIYRRVGALTRTAGGGLELDGPGERVESVLEMRRFDETAVLAEQPYAVDGELSDQLGRAIARFHAEAPVTRQAEPAGGMSYTIRSNASLLKDLIPKLGRDPVEALIAATDAERARLEGLLAERLEAGWVRRCHGDLHLGNILLEDGRPILFDCIEFNDTLSEIDVLYDVAFLLMDLDFRRRRDAAVRVLSAWLDEGARLLPEGLWSGLEALPLALSVRAGVRCHVQAHGGDIEASRAYLAAALAHLEPVKPVLAAVGGLSGSGKSTFARIAAPGLGASPGAVILRSDEIRKRLWGVAPLERLPAEAYDPEVSPRVYGQLFDDARQALAAGRAVILDAVFMKPEERAAAADVARRAGVAFEGLWLEAPAALLHDRIAGRTGDASDATGEVLDAQLTRDLGQMTWRRVDSDGAFEPAAEALVKSLS